MCAAGAEGAAIIPTRRPGPRPGGSGVITLDAQQPEARDPSPDDPGAAGATPPSGQDPEPPIAPPPGEPPTTPPGTPPPPLGTPPPPGAPPPPPGGQAKAKRPKPPGLREQLLATVQAGIRLAMAHVDLAKEEASEIGREGGRFAGLVAAAVALVIMAAFLAVIGTSLFLGEWLLGSIGWGVLHGVLLFVSAAVGLVLLALGVSPVRIGRALLIAVVVAVLTSIVLGLGLLNQAYTAIGDSLGVAVSTDLRPLVVGLAIGGLVGLVLGLVMAVQATANRFLMIAGGIVFGVVVGALTSITYGPQVGTGIGITIGYLTWAGLMAIDIQRTGIDMEALKARFTPTQTIDTSKETLEWLKERMPRGNGS